MVEWMNSQTCLTNYDSNDGDEYGEASEEYISLYGQVRNVGLEHNVVDDEGSPYNDSESSEHEI